MIRSLYITLVLCLAGTGLFAQSTTRNSDTVRDTSTFGVNGKQNVLIIPWSPRMFNGSSDVTRDISNTTGQNYLQIAEALRKGMCEQVKKSFAAKYNAISLLDDTAKMKIDLAYTYGVTTTEYVSVNSPLNPPPKKSMKDAGTTSTTGIKNGEVQVQQQEGEMFMNTVILSPNLLSHLKAIYKCEYVVFLNQLDMQDELGSDPFNTANSTDYKRSAILHWTIFSTRSEKRVAMGKTKALFANTINTPKKIIDGAFVTIGKAVYDKFITALTPKK